MEQVTTGIAAVYRRSSRRQLHGGGGAHRRVQGLRRERARRPKVGRQFAPCSVTGAALAGLEPAREVPQAGVAAELVHQASEMREIEAHDRVDAAQRAEVAVVVGP